MVEHAKWPPRDRVIASIYRLAMRKAGQSLLGQCLSTACGRMYGSVKHPPADTSC